MDNNDAVESLVPKSGKYSTKQANSQSHSHQKEDTPADPSVSLSSSAVMFDGTASSLDSHPFDNVRKTLLKYLRFVGPGLMITVAYMDPGNYATAVSAGAANRFAHLSIVLLSGAIAIFLQALCIKLGSVTGFDLSQACREFFPMWLNICLYLISEIAIISTDVAEVIGGAIALNILLRIPLPAGVCISCTDVFLVLLAYRPETSSMRMVRMFEMLVAMLVFAVTICLCIELAYIPPFSVKEMLRGFLPSGTIFSHKGVYIATSILGATVMPHSLFLGSGLVRPRLLEYDVKNGYYSTELDSNADLAEEKSVCKELRKEKIYMNYRPSIHAIRYAMKFSVTEVAVTLIIFALFINCSILIIAACSLYGTEEAIDADLYTIHDLLSKSLTPVAGTVFMLALLFSGQSSGIVCTIAGQMVCEGHIRWNLTPWKRRFITRGIAIIPCLIISVSIGKNGLSQALNASQVVLSCTLPFITAPLIYFTSKKSLMSVPADKRKVEDGSIACVDGDDADAASDCESQLLKKYVDFSNNWLTITVGCGIWVGICALVLYTYVSLGLSNGE